MPFLFLSMLCAEVSPQARLVINNAAFVVLNGGTSSAPIYLVIDNKWTNSITKMGTGGGIQSFGEFDRVKWFVKDAVAHADTTFVFPFIDSLETTSTPFSFNINSAGSSDASVSLATWYSANNTEIPTGYPVCPSENNAIDRFWVIDVAGTTKPSADIRFYYNTIDLDGITADSDLGAQRGNASLSCKWETPAVGTWYSGYVEVLNVSAFSPWTLVKKSSPLPIELLSFTGKCRNGKVELFWETAAETNNQSFSVEKTDGSHGNDVWVSVGTIPGAGNSSSVLSYSFTDSSFSNYKSPVYYYRLKQTDFDGFFSYSGVIAVSDCNYGHDDQIAIFIGNENEVILSLNAASSKRYDVFFYDNLGRRIQSEVLHVAEGENVKILHPGKFATGIYYITLQNGEEVIAKKIFLH